MDGRLNLNGAVGTVPGGKSAGAQTYSAMAAKAGIKKDGPYVGESYDSAALLALAMQAAGSSDRAAIQANMMKVANAPGTKIGPGEIAKGLKIIASGGDVDYVGGSAVELIGGGESAGNYAEYLVKGGALTITGYR